MCGYLLQLQDTRVLKQGNYDDSSVRNVRRRAALHSMNRKRKIRKGCRELWREHATSPYELTTYRKRTHVKPGSTKWVLQSCKTEKNATVMRHKNLPSLQGQFKLTLKINLGFATTISQQALLREQQCRCAFRLLLAGQLHVKFCVANNKLIKNESGFSAAS